MRTKRCIIVLALAAILAVPSSAQQKWAVVTLSSNFLREAPDYEAGNGTQALMGTVVEVIDSVGIWRKVKTPDPYVAWTNDLSLAYMDEAGKDAYIQAPKWICVEEYSHVYEEPDFRSRRICDLTMGDLVLQVRPEDEVQPATGVEGPVAIVRDWVKNTALPAIKGEVEATRLQPWMKVMLPSGKKGWVQARDIRDFHRWASSRKGVPENIIAMAERFVGVPYMWGGNTAKYFDCSGLVQFAYRMNGILLPRNCSEQVKLGEEIEAVPAAMQPGDLVFFGDSAAGEEPCKATHVGIYMGEGKMIHASQVVRINSLVEGEPDCYDRRILCVRRLAGHMGRGTGAISILGSSDYFKQ